MTWTDERRATCKRLWLKGASAGEIVDALGDRSISRNAVIGLINRAGLSRNPLNGAPRPAARPRPGRSQVGRRDSDVADGVAWIAAEPPDPDIPGLIVADMPRAGACHWPLSGAGADMVMCAQATDGTYCRAHHEMAYVPLTGVQKKSLRSLAGWACKR